MKENIIKDKSYNFALEVIKISEQLNKQRHFDLARQLLRSGTSIGANIEEANGAVSKKDFINKVGIAYKECRESYYWLRLLRDSDILSTELANELIFTCEDMLKILVKIQITARQNNQSQ